MSATATGTPLPGTTESLESDLTVIPESSRTTDVRGQFWIWAGANIAPINWILGALGVSMGLGLFETIAVLAVGNAIGMSLFGTFVVIGQRTGVTGMVLSRAVFGRRGPTCPPPCRPWCAWGGVRSTPGSCSTW
ncbi:permease, cytosine/purines, uracil, thiamine, allantoin family protein [Mycolicibacterium smegmatis MKD8]|uniref:Permease, cytosine/purines, uracil, thiamine, allantoin family protein n=1 Tax=Mycolicibacterium smegmatis (strain MKD8) TaxID=1214915 RepID=A0A2U9Q053_MYCSE|nr:permease, cytosine/purines, uracil, thiamine, allantoin family protein [Mycolicibacterium smegmatis MKD8]